MRHTLPIDEAIRLLVREPHRLADLHAAAPTRDATRDASRPAAAPPRDATPLAPGR
jgi:hypothetical protein